MTNSVAVVTGSTVPHPDLDEAALMAAIKQRGFDAHSVAWDDPTTDWSEFAVSVIRSTWNYENDRDAFVSWAYEAGTRTTLLNPPHVIDWNTEKSYLASLERYGVPVVRTTFTGPEETWSVPADLDEYVVKPSIAGGARNAGRFSKGVGDHRARSLAERIQASGRCVMTQPYLGRIDEAGERVLIFLGDGFSHAVLRGPILGPNGAYVDITRGWNTVDSMEPPAEEIDLAKKALSALDAYALTYARVDVVTADDGTACILEVELTEPCLFLGHKRGSVDVLADLVVTHVEDASHSRDSKR